MKKIILMFFIFSNIVFSTSHTKIDESKLRKFQRKAQMYKRPKIGLALSGGGSKGAAHIGVLKILKKYNVPIDYITGTSIGSVVGAMYASGMPLEEMEKDSLGINWGKMFSDRVDRSALSAEQKFLYNPYIFSLEIEKDEFKLKLPQGALTGHNMYLKLKELLWRAENITDFDELTIPFRAITTDINTGEAVVQSSGDIAFAAFKSMAIPSAIKPVKDTGEFYVDGGVAKNLPVQEAFDLGADIVIAVDITAGSTDIEDSSNIVSILDKLSTYQGIRNTNEQMELADLLIAPDVKSYGSLNFKELDEVLKKGENEALKYSEYLKMVSDPKFKRQLTTKKEKIRIDNIVISGNKILTKETVLNLNKHKGYMYNNEELQKWINKIYALDYIDRVFYHVVDNTLYLSILENSGLSISAGFNYMRDYKSTFGLQVKSLKKNSFFNNYILNLNISKYPGINLRFLPFYNFSNFKIFGQTIGFFDYDPLFYHLDNNKVTDFHIRRTGLGFEGGVVLFDKLLLGYSTIWNNVDVEYEEGDIRYKTLESDRDYFKSNLSLTLDSLDNKYYPNKGVNITGNYVSAFSKENFSGPSYSAHIHFPLTKKLSFGLHSSGGRLYDQYPVSEAFKIGGSMNFINKNEYKFYGLNSHEKLTGEFITGAISAQYNFSNLIKVFARYNTLTYKSNPLYENKNRSIFNDYLDGYGAGIGFDTRFGPLELIITNDTLNKKEGILHLNIGYTF